MTEILDYMITPAVMIIKYLGGAKRVSLISQCHVSAVYKWYSCKVPLEIYEIHSNCYKTYCAL